LNNGDFELKTIRLAVTGFGLRLLQGEQRIFKTDVEFQYLDNTF